MNKNIIDFYQIVRADENLLATFSATGSADEFSEIAVREAGKRGFQITEEEAKAVAIDIKSLCAKVTNDDELMDFELELIAAGVTYPQADAPAEPIDGIAPRK